jgi:hypothetical protein
MRKRRIVHGSKFTLFSDFLQSIVVDRTASFRRLIKNSTSVFESLPARHSQHAENARVSPPPPIESANRSRIVT